jgi:pimeloyl-[acyl-carrier protein] methyl ester esterase
MSPGTGLHHEDLGAGAPVVLVHGWAASSAVFAAEADLLARSCRVVAPDLRGHGGSAPAPFALADLAGDLVALFERLGLDGAVVAGWSLGAQVALAALPRLRPRVAGLVLVSATPRFTICDGWPHGLPAQAVEVLAHRVRRDPQRALDRFFESCFVEGELDAEGVARATALRARLRLPDAAAAQAGLEVLLREDLRAALPAVDLPTRVLHGERDPICPAGAGRALAAAIPGARLDVVPGAGHAPFLSHPGLLAEAVLSLVPGAPGPGGAGPERERSAP